MAALPARGWQWQYRCCHRGHRDALTLVSNQRPQRQLQLRWRSRLSMFTLNIASGTSEHAGSRPSPLAGWYLLTVCEEQQQMCGWTEIKADLQARGGLGEEEVVVILWASEERNRWKRKRIMLHNQAVYFPAWNGEHKKRCRDAFIVGASFGWLCHCLLPKTKMLKMHKKLAFLTNFPQNYWI